MLQSPSKSLRKLVQQHDIGLATAHKAVRRELKLFPYKIMAVQELKTTDHKKQLHYYDVLFAISRRRIISPIFFMNIVNSERYCSDILHVLIGQMTSDKINYS